MHGIQKWAIRLSITAILALAGVLLVSGQVEAQGGAPVTPPGILSVTPAEILPPTGRTVAGPGSFSTASFSFGPLHFIYSSSGFIADAPDLCVTVANEGALVKTFMTSGVVNTASFVNPGETESRCAQKVNRITLECPAGDCSGFWRVDRR